MSMTERIPLERISERAHAARPGRTALAVVAGLLFGLGWLAFRACALAWLAAAWCASAVIEGWQASREAETARSARAGQARRAR